MSDIGRRIKELREAKGLSQAELGRRAGVSAAAVSQWENRQTKGLKGASLIRAAQALGVEPSVLLSGSTLAPELLADELALLDAYRSLPAGHRVLALRVVKALK